MKFINFRRKQKHHFLRSDFISNQEIAAPGAISISSSGMELIMQKDTKQLANGKMNPGEMSLSDPIRSLRKCDLGGVIFGCTHATIAECHVNQLFGLPSNHINYVRNIEEGLPLFLFNYIDRKMYGLYVAAGPGQLNINPYAWTDGGSEKTPFPAQVAIRIKSSCHPLEEAEYKRVIFDNYYDPLKFFFELDHAQTRSLTALFKPSQNPINLRPPPAIFSLREATKKPQNSRHEKRDEAKDVELRQSDEETISDWEVLAESGSSNSNFNSNESSSNGDTWEDKREKGSVLVTVRKMAASCQSRDPSSSRGVGLVEASTSRESTCLIGGLGSYENGISARHELLQTIWELRKHITDLESKQVESARLTARLRETMEQSHNKISSLRSRIRRLESMLQASASSCTPDPPAASYTQAASSCTSKDGDNCCPLQLFVEQCLGSDNVIYLVGGNNGTKFLPDFDSFSPSLDVLTPLRSMSSPKSYVAVAALDGIIYVAGGYDGSWFDTVECYDRTKDEWTLQPSLTCEKGCHSGVSVDGKIYVLGGKNFSDYFSKVDMLDPLLGKWIDYIPMLEQRSTFGAAALNGAIYAVGGYDGTKYLSTGERLDMREPYWKKIPDMKTIRGCHSLAVLNDKLYAVGGYDGETAISSVESYDLRMMRWVMEEPMKCARGYLATAVVGTSLYAIGGVITDNDLILDTVECYRDGSGWTNTGLKAMGRRCCSAIAL
ncbi:Kelch-like protein 12 [Rhynchospora pubera]|uniref:Kelch-like protein 12 n=1 Tax=Rhynchospora pubera TaxID=906938 RepID=A0AAV8DVW5_9POAL|nr:Kelch-like protein 12 [Rhynchospora pubera]